ncbi:MAG: sulfite exporter TauE/SafE family protein [Deltaproteobacteria bacterium]|nr:sulfite exporter TauE/SafE family protein [Deltaproteobacteria bacterium]
MGFELFSLAELPLAPLDVGLLTAVALATSMLSAIVGMAGGITLLSVMLLYLDPLVAIPIHGVVQLVSNGSRAWVQRRHVERGIALRYGVLLLPMGFAGLGLAQSLPPDVTRVAIGVFVLLATWAPGLLLLGSHPEATDRNRRFFFLGGVVGFINVTIGATGPLIAPFFLNLGLSRQALVGTKATCQMLGHLAKLVVFGVVGFAFGAWALVLGLLCVAVVVGTWLGSRLLERVNEQTFIRLYKTVLTLVAIRLIAAVLISL